MDLCCSHKRSTERKPEIGKYLTSKQCSFSDTVIIAIFAAMVLTKHTVTRTVPFGGNRPAPEHGFSSFT